MNAAMFLKANTCLHNLVLKLRFSMGNITSFGVLLHAVNWQCYIQ